ncbi:MAG TPA: ion channel [Candidatus Limnocylindrales bacterium]|nr:ion channel [Candidatus Limnocylindrales bacterium]
MQKPAFDPGLTRTFTRPLSRAINKDGSFNVHRVGTTWRDVHPYLYLVNLSWPAFLSALFLGYVAVNTIFALCYYAIGNNQLQGIDAPDALGRFVSDFFFSAQTLSTVGYGNIAPKGLGAQMLSSIEALTGVLGFAIATGLLFGRVSRPSARIGFSENMVVAPYQDITSLQFRVVNRRTNDVVDLEARMLFMTVQEQNGQPQRRYDLLSLERPNVMFLPLTWTVVHPIDKDSPLFGLTADDLKRLQAEVMILVKAYDDTFSQTVLARYSYRFDEILWGRRFAPAFIVDDEGDLVLEVRKVSELTN